MEYHKLIGVIINRRSLKDTDRFLTIFTAESGKISVYARGVRSVKSKRGSQIDLFSHIKFEVIEKGGRRTLTHVELLDGHHESKTELKNIGRLFQIGELVDRLTAEDDPHTEVYDLLVTALAHLYSFDTPEYLHRFKKKLLLLLGYGDFESQDIDEYIDSLLTRPLRKIDIS
jgi:DNA repair protein RecO (recombination protein O)